jgi:hypothetical protein
MIANLGRLVALARRSTTSSIQRAFVGRVAESSGLHESSRLQTSIRAKTDDDLTPFQRWCTEGGVERAFTGNIWYERDVGTYHCVRCDKELFR